MLQNRIDDIPLLDRIDRAIDGTVRRVGGSSIARFIRDKIGVPPSQDSDLLPGEPAPVELSPWVAWVPLKQVRTEGFKGPSTVSPAPDPAPPPTAS